MTTYQENAIAANPNNEEPAKESRVIEADFGTSEIDPTSDSVILPPAGEEPRAWPKTFLSNEEAVQLLASKNSGLKPNLSRYAYRFVKRAFDIVLSLVALIVCLLPGVVLCAAILIKSPGASPLYSQQRIGRLRKDGSFRTFKMWKIRSMVPNADQLLEKYQDLNEADGPLFKIKEDPRVIPGIGSFIRRHSIDEFGQLVNVLKGDMSFIGPRPPLPKEVVAYDSYCLQRLFVKPGCGGIWQATARSDSSFAEMVELDLEYIQHSGITYDLSLIFKTARVVFTGEGAY